MKDQIDDLAQRIGAVLKAKGLTIAVAESLTAGKVQDAFGSVSGASDYFRGGMTAYHIDQKVKHLGVDRELAELCNCVSAAVAYQMADGVRKLMGTDISIATTGYAEPPVEGMEAYAFACVLVGTAGGQIMVQGENLTREQMRQKVVLEALECLAIMVGAIDPTMME
jgi:PncC family amidohydrolase